MNQGHRLDYADYREKVYAGWMGKSLGGTIGARMENHKAFMHLSHADLWPPDIVPNDDMDIQIVWLEALQEQGLWLDSDILAAYWQDRCWYNFCEYGIFLHNVQRGIHPPLSGTWNNRFFIESEGCPIRSEIWGLICPGNPALAAEYARMDAQLDHGGASVRCEMFLSAAAAAAFLSGNLEDVLDAGLSVLPAASDVHRMVAETRAICAVHGRYEDVWHLLVRRFGDRDASKALMNQAIVVAALIKGNGDFPESLRLAVNSGWDTDCTAATVGALLGIMHGAGRFPPEWVEKMGRALACGIAVKHREASFDCLTDDTARIGVEMAAWRNKAVLIGNAPEIPLRAAPAGDVRLGVSYPADPWLRAGQPTPVRLRFSNAAFEPRNGIWRLELPSHVGGSITQGTLSIDPGEETEVEVLLQPGPGTIWDRNLMTVQWRPEDGAALDYPFGLGGARLWRVYGPYFDMWDTTRSEICPYHQENQFAFPQDGDSWNHYCRLDKAYLDEARLLSEDIPEALPEQIQVGEDYLDGGQIAGFRGQACFYLVRELVADPPSEIAFNITTAAPHVVWYDGKELARRERPRDVSLQDGRVGPMRVGPEPRRLVIKLARQTDTLTLCAMPSGGGDPAREKGISMFADTLGNVPMVPPDERVA